MIRTIHHAFGAALLSLAAAALAGCGAAEPAPRAPAGACQPALATQFPCWPEGLAPADSALYVYNEVTIAAPPAVVWEHLTHADRWPQWFAGAKNVRFEAGGPVLAEGTAVAWEMLGATIRVTVRKAAAPTFLAWEGGASGVHAYHAWILLPVGGGTRVVTVETERGPVPSMLSFYLRGALHDAHDDWLKGLAKVAGPAPVAR
jgi:uncharacterized protein YndB with AHSA1/START domain